MSSSATPPPCVDHRLGDRRADPARRACDEHRLARESVHRVARAPDPGRARTAGSPGGGRRAAEPRRAPSMPRRSRMNARRAVIRDQSSGWSRRDLVPKRLRRRSRPCPRSSPSSPGRIPVGMMSLWITMPLAIGSVGTGADRRVEPLFVVDQVTGVERGGERLSFEQLLIVLKMSPPGAPELEALVPCRHRAPVRARRSPRDSRRSAAPVGLGRCDHTAARAVPTPEADPDNRGVALSSCRDDGLRRPTATSAPDEKTG